MSNEIIHPRNYQVRNASDREYGSGCADLCPGKMDQLHHPTGSSRANDKQRHEVYIITKKLSSKKDEFSTYRLRSALLIGPMDGRASGHDTERGHA
jgi:hypothetical protein